MELIVEIVLEILVEGGLEIASSKKISNRVRYFAVFLIILFYLVVVFGMITIGILIFKNSILGGIFIVGIGLLLLVLSIIKFNKLYIEMKKK